MATSPSPAITIPDSEVIRDEDVQRDDKPSIGKRLNDWWKTPSQDLRSPRHAPQEPPTAPTYSSPQQRLGAVEKGVAIGSLPLLGAGLATAPVATALGVGGSLAGGYVGSKAGEEVGKSVDAPDIGRDIGSVLGSGAGGYTGGKMGMRPQPVSLNPKGPFVPASESPGPYRGPASVPKPVAPEPPLGSPENPGLMSKIPTGRGSMPKPLLPDIADVSQSPGPYRGPSSAPPNVESIAEGPTAQQHAATRGAQADVAGFNARQRVPVSESPNPRLGGSRGSILGGGGDDVPLFPEPKEPLPGDRPGSAWSLKRPNELPAAAQRGSPGAGDVLKNLRPILYEPRSGTGYPRAPGEFEALQGRQSLFGGGEGTSTSGPEIGTPTPPESQGGGIPQGNPTPFGTNRRLSPGSAPGGVERRAGLQDWQNAIDTTPPGQPTPGESLESNMRQSRGSAPSGVSEGEALQRIMRDPEQYERYRTADQKGRDQMLVTASRQ